MSESGRESDMNGDKTKTPKKLNVNHAFMSQITSIQHERSQHERENDAKPYITSNGSSGHNNKQEEKQKEVDTAHNRSDKKFSRPRATPRRRQHQNDDFWDHDGWEELENKNGNSPKTSSHLTKISSPNPNQIKQQSKSTDNYNKPPKSSNSHDSNPLARSTARDSPSHQPRSRYSSSSHDGRNQHQHDLNGDNQLTEKTSLHHATNGSERQAPNKFQQRDRREERTHSPRHYQNDNNNNNAMNRKGPVEHSFHDKRTESPRKTYTNSPFKQQQGRNYQVKEQNQQYMPRNQQNESQQRSMTPNNNYNKRNDRQQKGEKTYKPKNIPTQTESDNTQSSIEQPSTQQPYPLTKNGKNVLIILNIGVTDDRDETLEVCEGDDPYTISKEFCDRFGMGDEYARYIAQQIKSSIEQFITTQ